MDLGQLTQQFRIETSDTAEPYLWSDESIAKWASEAEREACFRARLIYDDSTPEVCEIAVLANQSIYPLHIKVDLVVEAYLTDAYGMEHPLDIIDRQTYLRDIKKYNLTTPPAIPAAIINDERSITFSTAPPADFTLSLGVYRLPLADVEISVDEFEIAETHHNGLIDWVKHRAYSIPDADAYDANKSEQHETEFIRRFGIRIDANVRRKHREKRRHVIRCSF